MYKCKNSICLSATCVFSRQLSYPNVSIFLKVCENNVALVFFFQKLENKISSMEQIITQGIHESLPISHFVFKQ